MNEKKKSSETTIIYTIKDIFSNTDTNIEEILQEMLIKQIKEKL